MKRPIFLSITLLLLAATIFAEAPAKSNQKSGYKRYLNELLQNYREIVNGDHSKEKLVKTASLASGLIQVVKDKKNKLKIAKMGYRVAQILMNKYPNDPSGYYYSALHLGYMALYIGPENLLMAIPRIKKLAEKAIKLDPFYHKGSPQVLLCALYFEAPTFPISIGDIEKARQYCSYVVKEFPESCTPYLYLAAIAQILEGNEKAREILLKGEKNCAPIDNSIEEKWFYQRDIETIRQLLKELDKGVSIKGFMRNR